MKFKVKARVSDKMVIFDGQHLCYRCFHSLNLTDPGGRPIGAVYGVIKSIKNAKKKFPGYTIAFAWDRSPKVRKELYPEYKAHRGEKPAWFQQFLWQVDRLKEVIPLLGVDQYEAEGYEADDLGAELVRLYKDRTHSEPGHCVIVTSDKDWMQLVDSKANVIMWDSMKDVMYDEKAVCEVYSVADAPGVAMVKSILGDSSDNVPAIKRFPKKTVSYIASRWVSPEDMYREFEIASEIPDKWKTELRNNREMVERNYKLVKLGYLQPKGIVYMRGNDDVESLKAFYNKHGFKSMLTEMAKDDIVKRSVKNANKENRI